jgi:uncharacterized integral membrane protein
MHVRSAVKINSHEHTAAARHAVVIGMEYVRTDRNYALYWIWAAILVHLAIAVLHGASHQGAEVFLSAWQGTFVLVVILILPLVAGVLLTIRRRIGARLLLLSMAASLIFGVLFHFVLPTSDHVAHVSSGPWQRPFIFSAAALAISEVVGCVAGVVAVRNFRS